MARALKQLLRSPRMVSISLFVLQLASHLLVLAMGRLRRLNPACQNHVTLSPMPRFRSWVSQQLQDEAPWIMGPAEKRLLRHMARCPHCTPPRSSARVVASSASVEATATNEPLHPHRAVHAVLDGKKWYHHRYVGAVVKWTGVGARKGEMFGLMGHQ